jgi:hypothetical protein
MENNEHERKLEQWLDEALSEYTAAEPRFGLEQRVLNRVHSEEKARTRWGLWKWMPAFAAIAAVAIIGVAIRPVLIHKSAPLQMSSGIEQQVSPRHSEEKIVARATESAVAGPAKKALAKKEVDSRVRDKGESRIEASPARADSTNGELKDRGLANAFLIDGSAPTNGRVAAATPPPPQPQISGRSYQSVIVNQPSSAGASTKDELTAERARVQRDAVTILDQGQISEQAIQAVPMKAATQDSKAAAGSAPTGIVGVEAVTVAKETVALKRMKKEKKEKEQAAQERAGDAAFAGAFGTVVRTEIKQLPAGPMQFPSPTPLSEQEKLVLAAAKKMKDAPVKQDAQSGSIPAIEIKDIQITPLEGPKK